MADSTPRPSPMRRVFGRILTLSLTTAIVAGTAAAGVVGYGALATRAAIPDAPAAAPPLPVDVARIDMREDHTVTRRFAGQVEARQTTGIAFEEGGTIADVSVREGDRVSEGAVIARLDTRLLDAERARLVAARDALEAQVELAQRTNARRAELLERGHATAQQVDETSLALAQLRAGIAEAEAGIAAVDVRLSKAVIRAPYAGTIGTRTLDAGAVASPGQPVVSLLEDGPARFRAGVAPDVAGTLRLGDAVTVEIDGRALPARLAQVAPELDAATRSRTLFFDLDGSPPPSLSTGEIVLTETVRGAGAWLPLSALRQGPEGSWRIVTVADGVAGVEAVEVLRTDGDRVFVRGTIRDGMAYLPDGTHRVVPGEPVAPQGGA